MRWPIRLQLLLPMFLIAALGIGLTSATSGYLGAQRARNQQEENLRRVVATLTEATFPLTDRVLRQMSGLSGAEFVLLDPKQQIAASTLEMSLAEIESLRRMAVEKVLSRVSGDLVLQVAGRRYLGHRVPVVRLSDTAATGSLVVLYQEDRWRSAVRQAIYPAALAAAVAAAAVVLLTTMLARRFVRPIRQLGVETARIAQGCFLPVAVPTGDDEIHDLALSVNSMAEKLGQYEQDVRTSERVRTLGQLGAAVAHQLRNLATGARMAVELHQRECRQGNDHESLEVALRQLRLMESYLQRFLRIGRSGSLTFQKVDLSRLLEEVLELLRPRCVHGRIDLGFRKAPGEFAVWGDADSLRDLLMNVVLNAVDAATRPAAAEPRVAVELDRLAADRAVVHVKDSGAGPAAPLEEHLFQPLVSEKPEGAGLGLFVAREVAQAHHGSIRWRRLDQMTCFSIELPLIVADTDHGSPADR
jgi:signal transduction histidine kinase